MVTRTVALVPVIIAAVIIGTIGVLTIPQDAELEPSEDLPRGAIRVDGIPLQVQIADTDASRTVGLKFQDPLPYDEGMIFVFEEPGRYVMWMPNVKFALDMIWFDADGGVVHIERDVPPCNTVVELAAGCPRYAPGSDALYVLEVTAGFVERNGITHESVLELVSI